MKKSGQAKTDFWTVEVIKKPEIKLTDDKISYLSFSIRCDCPISIVVFEDSNPFLFEKVKNMQLEKGKYLNMSCETTYKKEVFAKNVEVYLPFYKLKDIEFSIPFSEYKKTEKENKEIQQIDNLSEFNDGRKEK